MPKEPLFSTNCRMDGRDRAFDVRGPEGNKSYRLNGSDQQHYLDFFAALARDFGTRLPINRRHASFPEPGPNYRLLLDRNISPDILYGYGDPAVLWVEEERLWYLVVTSNDAPNSFPILRSPDLRDWELAGFVFPEGRKPAWAADGPGLSDYWAPELHRLGEGGYLLCFTARERDGSLSIGMARSERPEGPFTVPAEPLLRGGMIDGHIFIDADGSPFLFWKADNNGVWPRLLARLLADRPRLVGEIFERDCDRRTAAFTASLWDWGQGLPQMEQFFLLQPLIEAAVANHGRLRERLELRGADAAPILEAMRTPIHAQRLSPDGLSLCGESRIVLVNDRDWEGHLIEGPWLTRQHGLYWLFYSGNDFSTAEYGIGVAVADRVLGPYQKHDQPLLQSTSSWSGPGHPSVARGTDGSPHLFFHAFHPGTAGYKSFRVLLTTGLDFEPDRVSLRQSSE